MSDDANSPRPWDALPKWPRRAISAWLAFHLIAVISAPASVAPASDLARASWSICRPYLQTLYLNHGYHFFAPNPGESTLLAFTVERADGSTFEDAIPHPRISPRLLYHRYFMLTESLAMVAGESDRRLPAEERPTEVLVRTDESTVTPLPPQGLLRAWYESYARCILDHSAGERVHLTRVVHYLPEIEWMQSSIARGEPLTLNEPQSFAEFPIGTFNRHGLLESGEPSPHRKDAGPQDRATPEQNDLVLTHPPTGGQP